MLCHLRGRAQQSHFYVDNATTPASLPAGLTASAEPTAAATGRAAPASRPPPSAVATTAAAADGSLLPETASVAAGCAAKVLLHSLSSPSALPASWPEVPKKPRNAASRALSGACRGSICRHRHEACQETRNDDMDFSCKLMSPHRCGSSTSVAALLQLDGKCDHNLV